jgi:hypothetical protein
MLIKPRRGLSMSAISGVQFSRDGLSSQLRFVFARILSRTDFRLFLRTHRRPASNRQPRNVAKGLLIRHQH